MFRDAEIADLGALVDMGRRFHGESGLADFVAFDPASFEASLKALIESNSGFLLVAVADHADGAPIGMAGVFAFPPFYNARCRMAGEIFFWIEPDHRGIGARFLTAIETKAKAGGIDVLHVAHLERIKPAATAKFYARRGYEPVEHVHYRRL